MRIVTTPITKKDLEAIAQNQFGDFVKAVVDVAKNIMAIGGDLHADEEALLLENGSEQKDLWGVNLFFSKTGDDWIEFDSMINVRPSQGNASRSIKSKETCEVIRKVVFKLVIK
jgi:hypothetical protein